MTAPQLRLRSAALAVLGALALAGCASSSIQASATTFYEEHAIVARRLSATTKLLEGQLSRLPDRPSASRLEGLSRAAALARRDAVRASEWNIAKSGEGGEEGAEEEDLPRAETEATEAASELANAMSALQAYARAPRAAALARYGGEFARGREQWDESISQLWYLAHEKNPPVI